MRKKPYLNDVCKIFRFLTPSPLSAFICFSQTPPPLQTSNLVWPPSWEWAAKWLVRRCLLSRHRTSRQSVAFIQSAQVAWQQNSMVATLVPSQSVFFTCGAADRSICPQLYLSKKSCTCLNLLPFVKKNLDLTYSSSVNAKPTKSQDENLSFIRRIATIQKFPSHIRRSTVFWASIERQADGHFSAIWRSLSPFLSLEFQYRKNM